MHGAGIVQLLLVNPLGTWLEKHHHYVLQPVLQALILVTQLFLQVQNNSSMIASLSFSLG